MSWDWYIVLKSLLFWFLGLLTGIFALMIYMVVDGDLSQLDGTLIATIVLAIATIILAIATTVSVKITSHYAKSTKEILDEQRKSRQIADIKEKLEFYYPLEIALSSIHRDENYVEFQLEGEQTTALIKILEEKHKYYYLAKPKLRYLLKRLVYVNERCSNDSETMPSHKAYEELMTLIPKISKLIQKDISDYNIILNE